jgi:hypothetical protein
MRSTLLPITTALLLVATAGAAENDVRVSGTYVEARTAEVFAGGCIMNSQAETMGKQAVMAWQVDEGSVRGVAVNGLSVVAAVSANHNLGIREMGGATPTEVKALFYVDERATTPQREALVAMATTATADLAPRIVEVRAVPIAFDLTGESIAVKAGDATLRVEGNVPHDPSCGAMQWFNPLSRGADAKVGLTRTQGFSGQELGSRWRQAEQKSAFVGTFSF